MKYILAFYYILQGGLIISQDSLKFLSTVYVTDAIGNLDSVTIGTSYYANRIYNPNMGELAIDTPFDSILEVRAGHAGLWAYMEPDYILSKKIISGSESKVGKNGVPIRLFINAKHQPITISWSKDFLDPKYFLGTFMTPDAHQAIVNPIYWWKENPVRFQCMNKYTNYTLELTSKVIQDFEGPYYVVRPIMGSENPVDSIFGVAIIFAQSEMYSPCQLISNIIEDHENKRLSVYPNPAHEYINISSDIERLEIWDIEGKLIKIIETHGDYFIGDLSNGLYIIRGKIDKNWLTGKLVKI